MPDYLNAPGIAQPRRAHTLTPAAEHARQAVRDFARRRQAERDAPPELVTEHPREWEQADAASLTGSAATFAKAALAAGHKTLIRTKRDRVEVRVLAGASGLVVAWWKAGLSSGANIGLTPVPVTVATYALSMPARDAMARYQRESDARKAAAAATRAAKAAS